MLHRHEIKDADWKRIKYLLPGQPQDPGVTVSEEDNRLFVNAIRFVGKTGIPWRDLPERFGNWNSVYQRYNRWCRKGVLARIFEELQDPDLEWLMLDSSVIRTHQHAAGAEKKNGQQSVGRSRGGFSTKVHAAVDSLGNPVKLTLTAGQVHDSKEAASLLDGLQPQGLIGDKGYDVNALLELLAQRGIASVIPPKENRKEQWEYDRHTYKERNLVERFFNQIKHYRRVATRYDKLDRNYLGFVHLSAIMVLLR